MGRKDAFRGVKEDLWEQIARTFNAERAEKDKVSLGANLIYDLIVECHPLVRSAF